MHDQVPNCDSERLSMKSPQVMAFGAKAMMKLASSPLIVT